MKKRSITLVNNEQYYYIDEGQGKDVLVLLHGNMSSSVHLYPLIARLKQEYRVIAPDLRGFGDSTYKKSITSLHDLADDVIDFLRILGIKKYHLGGWSTGGAIALSIASKQPRDVSDVVLIESCSYRGYPIFKKNEQFQPIIGEHYQSKKEMALDPVQVAPMVTIFETGDVATMKMIWDQAIYTVNKPEKEEEKLYLSETLKQRNIVDIDWGLTNFNMSNFTNGVSFGNGEISQVICPVLSLWSDKDITVLEYMIDETVEALSNARKVVLHNSGHSPLVDCPEELVNEIKKFIHN
jgi:pimeloyl-ACP methyl ester carboxylesterase